MADPRPVLLVTNHAPAFRIPSFAALHAAQGIEVALIGGRVRHGGAIEDVPLPFGVVRPPGERGVARLAASGRYRAVVAGLSGRVALPAAYAGARAARVPFVLWATVWRHPRTPAHAASYLPLRHLYRHADAVVTYGPHVSAYVRGKGRADDVFEAPQAVDTAFWTQPGERRHDGRFTILVAGRLEPEKGIDTILAAVRDLDHHAERPLRRDDRPEPGARPSGVRLVLAGDGPLRERAAAAGAETPGRVDATQLRNLVASADVVVVPSVPTRAFLEPWGLVVNEAFHQGIPVIATTAVGAAAGGLVKDGRTGLVVAPADPPALAVALRSLRDDAALRERLGAAARQAVSAYTPEAWAAGVGRALSAVNAGRTGC